MRRISCIFLFAMVLSGTALGQDYDMRKAPVVRNKTLMREGRHEIAPGLSSLFNGRYYHAIVFHAAYRYHITDWFAVGAEGGHALSWKTGLANNVESERSTEAMAFSIPATQIGAMGNVHLAFTPKVGKLLLFGRHALHFDFHMNVGASALQVKWNEAAADSVSVGNEFAIGPMLGGGFRLFFNRGLALSIDMTDHFVNMYVAAPTDSKNVVSTPERAWTHNMMATLTLNIFLPYRGADSEQNE